MPFPLALRSPRQVPDQLHPAVTPAGSPLLVFLDHADGAVRDLRARSLTVRTQQAGRVRDGAVRRGGVEVLLTDARIVLTAGRPTPESVLAGHVPLEWIVAVGGSTGGGLFSSDALRLVLQLDTGEYRVLTLLLDGGIDVHELAQDIARRTARRWVDVLDGDAVPAWQALLAAPRLDAGSGEFALHSMPEHRRVPWQSSAAYRLGVPA